jgi:predicted RNase H-like HicB family nuclease
MNYYGTVYSDLITFEYFCVITNYKTMKINFIYWKDGNHWLGYIDEYPDYLSQGTSLEDLKINLKDLYSDLKSGEIPNIRKKGELEVA